jgi:hypothetical protein
VKQPVEDKALLLNVLYRPALFGLDKAKKMAPAAVVVSPCYQRVYVDSWKTKKLWKTLEKYLKNP